MTGIPELTEKDFGISVYPNPADQLAVWSGQFARNTTTEIKVFGSTGKLILKQDFIAYCRTFGKPCASARCC